MKSEMTVSSSLHLHDEMSFRVGDIEKTKDNGCSVYINIGFYSTLFIYRKEQAEELIKAAQQVIEIFEKEESK